MMFAVVIVVAAVVIVVVVVVMLVLVLLLSLMMYLQKLGFGAHQPHSRSGHLAAVVQEQCLGCYVKCNGKCHWCQQQSQRREGRQQRRRRRETKCTAG